MNYQLFGKIKMGIEDIFDGIQRNIKQRVSGDRSDDEHHGHLDNDND